MALFERFGLLFYPSFKARGPLRWHVGMHRFWSTLKATKQVSERDFVLAGFTACLTTHELRCLSEKILDVPDQCRMEWKFHNVPLTLPDSLNSQLVHTLHTKVYQCTYNARTCIIIYRTTPLSENSGSNWLTLRIINYLQKLQQRQPFQPKCCNGLFSNIDQTILPHMGTAILQDSAAPLEKFAVGRLPPRHSNIQSGRTLGLL